MGQLAVAAAFAASAATVFGQKQKANPMNVQNFSISIWKGRRHTEAKKCCVCVWVGACGGAWLVTMRERVCSCQRQQTTLIEFKVSKCRVLRAMQRQSYFFCAPAKFYKQHTHKAHVHTVHTHTHSGANCTIGTVARTEREREKCRKTLCERATACKTALSVVATHTHTHRCSKLLLFVESGEKGQRSSSWRVAACASSITKQKKL